MRLAGHLLNLARLEPADAHRRGFDHVLARRWRGFRPRSRQSGPNRGPVRFRKIRRLEDAVKWARAMLWRVFLLLFFIGAILTAGTSVSLLAWWYLGSP